MAGGSARIGALHVLLGIDSAQFTAGMKKAGTDLDKFARNAKIGMAVVATAAAAAGVALAVAVKGAIDNADAIGEMAQSAGVSVEALSSMGYAANQSGVGLEGLATGFEKLSKNMLAVAQGGTGPVAAAFAALGVNVQNASGSLRDGDQVMLDVADKFARMENGATKTALAVQIFGKSGADLIPFLNAGRAGISELTDAADRMGITLSGSTAAAAGQFNDTLDAIKGTFQGVINTIMVGALPSLNQLASKLADPAFAAAAQALAQGVVGAINMIVDAISAAGSKLQEFGNLLDWMSSRDWSTGELDPAKVEARQRGAMAEVMGQLGRGEAEAPDAAFMDSIFGAPASEVAAAAQQVATAFEPVITNTEAAAAGASALKAAMSEGKAVFESTRTPAEAYGLEVERLNALLQKGAIDQDTYNRAVTQAQDSFQQAEMAGNQLASTLSSGLADVFSSVVDGSKTAVEAVGDLLKSLGDMLIHQGFQSLIGGLFGGTGGGGGGIGSFISGLFGGGGGGLQLGFNGIPGFDGGGFTGSGARSGGLDGKGGFLSMLHPDETVLDHTKGQDMAGPTISINITGSRQDAAEIAREVRKVLPDAMQAYNRNPLRRTS